MSRDSWAPYCADTIAFQSRIRIPQAWGGSFWVSVGTATFPELGERLDRVYRVVGVERYESPHADLPCGYAEHTALPESHPFRWGYEGMLVSMGRSGPVYVLTDEHVVPQAPVVPGPAGGWMPDPAWDWDAVVPARTPGNPWSKPRQLEFAL